MIQHIPDFAPVPRTLSEAKKVADFNGKVAAIKAARCPDVHGRAPAPRWPLALTAFMVVTLVGLATALLGWAPVVIMLVAVLVIVWALATMNEQAYRKWREEVSAPEDPEQATAG
jgi:Flp pilus assembly protein TadB